MPSAPERKGNKPTKQLAAIDRLLIAGIKLGPAKKRDAINRVLDLARTGRVETAGSASMSCGGPPNGRLLRSATQPRQRSHGEAAAARRPASRPWTPADDDRLLNLAGYEPVKRIAQRLDRSVRAVRFRMAALGMSARVTDAWSLRALWKMLRVRPSRLSVFHRKRPTEGARCPHIGKLPGGVLRAESAICRPPPLSNELQPPWLREGKDTRGNGLRTCLA